MKARTLILAVAGAAAMLTAAAPARADWDRRGGPDRWRHEDRFEHRHGWRPEPRPYYAPRYMAPAWAPHYRYVPPPYRYAPPPVYYGPRFYGY